MTPRVAVIGAGYAGLACAVELTAAGIPVDVFEASRSLGGRARAVELEGITVDNGAHILVGAYRETLRLMRTVGVDIDAAFLRHPLHLEYPGELTIHAPRLPAPLHTAAALLGAQGLNWHEKLAAVRFMRWLQARDFRLERDLPMWELLARQRQPARLTRYLWEPLCVASLNTELGRASAQVFANVLHDSLAADRAASDLLLPRRDFSVLFPEPAAAWLAAHGATVRRETRIEAIRCEGNRFRLDDHGTYERVVLAVAPYHLGRLVAGLPELASLADDITHLDWEPIVGAYLAYPESVRLPFPMCGVAGGSAQWLFDRGVTHGQPGLIAAVISAHGRHEALTHEQLAQRIHNEIARIVPGLPSPRWSRIIVEKRATFACTPGLRRPQAVTPLPGLWLAGDYVAGDYPATIEGAVRSGINAARVMLD